MIVPTVSAVEATLKKALFDCHHCGSCLLSQTRLICPMTCPKGLRNGPCGGSLDGKCEVYEDQPCIWISIHDEREGVTADPIHAPFDEALLKTSSLINLATKADQDTRLPLKFLELHPRPMELPPQTRSRLEQIIHRQGLVLTTEIRSPRKGRGMEAIAKEVESLLPWMDAFNATSSHGGVKTVSSFETAALIKKIGGDPILQVCGRDVNPESFLEEAKQAYDHGIFNTLCLTGDWAVQEPRHKVPIDAAHKRFFRMDSSQMVYELRHLRELGQSAFAPKALSSWPQLFIGAVANPYTLPRMVSLCRLAQKIACGADFIQTQIITDLDPFGDWVHELERSGWRQRIRLIASVPIITKPGAFQVLCNLKGIHIPFGMRKLFEKSGNLEETGMAFARSTIERLLDEKLVDGIHLTNFGAKTSQLIELASFARERFQPQPAALQEVTI